MNAVALSSGGLKFGGRIVFNRDVASSTLILAGPMSASMTATVIFDIVTGTANPSPSPAKVE